ncbi:MAG: RNA polymerase subunit sigma-24 [Defluviitaleaceae bacterium]|nr:RNA polymerase subunit sigma-24 [Defluviitaleaceae bacterium]
MKTITLRELEEYRLIKNEIVQITESLEKLGNAATFVFDTVKGSSSQIPYQERVIPIVGVSPKYMKIYNKRKQRLELLLSELLDKLSQIEDFIKSINQSDIRQIIELRYIKGLSWKITAKKVYGYASEDAPRKAIKRYFLQI